MSESHSPNALHPRYHWCHRRNRYRFRVPRRPAEGVGVIMSETTRQKKITFGEMREAGVDHILIYCDDYK
jgi:hypothetical protein